MIMGTRSLTYVYDDDVPVVCMYCQFDGYPSGHGAELAEFLTSGELVDGLSIDDTKVFNGMCCLAAQMVAHFKKGPGDIYLMSPVVGADYDQEYEYHVRLRSIPRNELRVEVRVADHILFEGPLAVFKAFCKE